MRNFNRFIRIFIMVAMAVGMAGCDVSKDGDDKLVLELNETKAALEEANAKIAAMEKPESGDPGIQKQLDEANAKIAAMEKPESGDPGIQKQLDEAQEKEKTLAAQVSNLTEENNRLQGLLEKLQATYAELEKKLKDFQGAGEDLKSGLPLNP